MQCLDTVAVTESNMKIGGDHKYSQHSIFQLLSPNIMYLFLFCPNNKYMTSFHMQKEGKSLK